MKKVLHVIDSLHLGGAQEVVLNLATCGDRARFSHEVATMHGRGVYWERMAALGIPLHSLSPHKLFPWYAASLPALLLGGNFDILHCHLVASNIIAKPIGRLCRVPVVINHDHTNDDYRANDRVRLALDSLSNRLASHIIAVSDSCRRFLIERERVPSEKITLIQNAIDLRRFLADCGTRAGARKLLGLPENGPVVAGVGRLNPQKNFSLFIRIAAEVLKRHPEAVFLLAGEGPEEGLLRMLAQDSGVGERLHFCGYVPDTRQIYLAADVLLMPSLFEGLPMTLLEAMAMRVPVVASALDGIAEVVDDGRDGFLVPSGRIFESCRAQGERASRPFRDWKSHRSDVPHTGGPPASESLRLGETPMPPGKIREVATFGDAPVPSGNGKLFCERVCQLIENPSLAGDMGAAASEKISRRFSAGRMCREVEEIYDRYLK